MAWPLISQIFKSLLKAQAWGTQSVMGLIIKGMKRKLHELSYLASKTVKSLFFTFVEIFFNEISSGNVFRFFFN